MLLIVIAVMVRLGVDQLVEKPVEAEHIFLDGGRTLERTLDAILKFK